MITAMRAASETLRDVLLSHFQSDPGLQMIFTPMGAGVVSLATPDEMVNAGESGVSLWLYRVVRDEQRLNVPPQRLAADRLRPTPLPVRLHYLVTPILSGDAGMPAPETEQHVLGAVLQTFYDLPLINGAALAGDFSGTRVELAVRLESLALEEMTRIWDSLERSYQLCLSYEVGVVVIESARQTSPARPVTIALPEVGPATPELVP